MPELNVGRSLRVAKAYANWNNIQVAERLGVSPQRVVALSKRQHASTATVDKLAVAFGMTPTGFLQLGQIDEQ
ncbi:MAG: hypothetical protein ACQES7_04245 [Pseudomonadota bacterium]